MIPKPPIPTIESAKNQAARGGNSGVVQPANNLNPFMPQKKKPQITREKQIFINGVPNIVILQQERDRFLQLLVSLCNVVCSSGTEKTLHTVEGLTDWYKAYYDEYWRIHKAHPGYDASVITDLALQSMSEKGLHDTGITREELVRRAWAKLSPEEQEALQEYLTS